MRTHGSPRPILSTVIALAATAIVIALGIAITGSASWTSDENAVIHAVNATHSAVADGVALGINALFGPTGAILLVLVLAIAFGRARDWHVGMLVIALIALPWLATGIFKVIVGRIRPDPSVLSHVILIEPRSFSFPSGHTAFAAALMTTLVILLWSTRARLPLVLAAVSVVLLTGWSRVYVGAHYPTDVMASAVLVPTLCIALYAVTQQAVPALHDSAACPSSSLNEQERVGHV